MLTRSQVARRIGRSLATVRRLEGDVLHPEVDERGVHRFREEQVEVVARKVRDSGVSGSTVSYDLGSGSLPVEDLDEETSWRDLQKRVRDAEHKVSRVQAKLDETRARHQQFLQRAEYACAELIRTLGYTSPATIRAIERLVQVWERHEVQIANERSWEQLVEG